MTETSRLKLGAHAASGNRKPRKAMLAPLGALLVFLLCACPAEGLIPSSSLAIRSCRHARRVIETGPRLRSLVLRASSPEQLDQELDKAGQEWRTIAAQQDSDAMLDYVEWLRTDRKSMRQALVAGESANGSSGRAGLTAWDNRAAQGSGSGGVGQFDLALAIELAGFAFETYNPPERGRWEEGTDGVKVAFMSEAFAASCYRGLLTVTLREADQLPRESMVEALASGLSGGSGFNPFVMFAIVEGSSSEDGTGGSGKSLPFSGVRGLPRAFDIAQSSTSKARDYETAGGFGGMGKEVYSRAFWGDNSPSGQGAKAQQLPPARGGTSSESSSSANGETFYLYVKDPSTAQLVTSVEEDSVLKTFGKGKGASRKPQDQATAAKVVVGSTSKPLTELLEGCDQPYDDQPSTSSSSSSNSLPAKSQIPWPSWPLSRWPVTWSGWLPLTHAPAEDKTGKAAGAALAGALMGGPMGAAMAGGAALLWNKEVKGRVLVDLSYQPLEVANVKPQQGSSRSSGNDDGSALSKKEENIDKTEEEVHQPRPPKGGTPGLDWGDLALGMNVAESASKLEFCAFVDTSETDTQAALWRDSEAKRLVVAFRGTSSPGDLLVDAQILQTPWQKKRTNDKVQEGEPMVHAGFREACDSISRRLKELVLAAVDGELSEWDLLITGHSLGGALATLFTTDLALHGCDAGRGLPTEAPSKPWWGRLLETPQEAKNRNPPRPKRLICYTYGCPRVGNRAFADLLSKKNAPSNLEIYRVVSGADVVARLPRHGNAVSQILDYEHSGPTVLVSDQDNSASEVGDLGGGGASTTSSNGDNTSGSRATGSGGADSSNDRVCLGALWVEGETDNQPCPLRETSPLVDPLADGALLFEALRAGVQRGSVQAMFDKLTAVSPSEISQLVGLDGRFLAAELQLVDSLRRGDAIVHHLEPSYFKALANAAQASGLWDQRAAGGKPPPTDVAEAMAAAAEGGEGGQGMPPVPKTFAGAAESGSNTDRLRAAGIIK